MWIKQCIARSSVCVQWGLFSMCLHAWLLLTVLHLVVDLSICSPLGQGSSLRLGPAPGPGGRARAPPIWALQGVGGPYWRTLGNLRRSPPPSSSHPAVRSPAGDKGTHGGGPELRLARRRRAVQPGRRWGAGGAEPSPLDSLAFLEGGRRAGGRPRRQLQLDEDPGEHTTTVSGFIDWGPTGVDEVPEEEGRARNGVTVTRQSVTTTTPAPTTTTTTQSPKRTRTEHTTTHTPRRLSTTSASSVRTARPPKHDTPGLAVHQIITITVSLIMVIAALITTLVLKNCCAQSGNGRHSSHQRKINQQEESCQNLTDFTPARVPSKVDIFTAYNDSLQCPHECVRNAVPIYTDEMIQHTPIYKTTYNGSRPSPSERQLIPVAFVSEKWFEISC
ncbi:adherens junction-associated protein 1 [Clupea harengus]|uniref:Adherens junction-associated protein 1 n=1 Tax=Clupea harengus TaxID=7950 RepID=A0A6P8FGH0_CLUHA|nr:adherens junction-associated protein 1 [Clupea harengus]